MKRSSTAIWHGSGKEGTGHITSQSKALNNVFYSSRTRFDHEPGTNPEELIAAAHSSCFTMKLAYLLSEARFVADEIETTSTVTIQEGTITDSHLIVKCKIPGISSEKFQECAEKSKSECPVSKALSINITMEASLL